jgi:UDP-glucose 4-epimerase
VFNVGTGVETSVNALAATIARVTLRPLPVEHIDRRDVDNIRRRVVNIEKIRRVLHWTPQVTLESGIERTVEWFVGAGPAADAEAAGRTGG